MKASSVWLRNRVYFYLSFFSAGSQGIITQLFLRRRYPENKELLLACILAAGALSYIAGIWISGKRLGASINAAKAMLLLNLATFVSLLTATTLVPYVISYCLACFSCNFAYNFLDHRYLGGHSAEELGVHVQSLLVYQMFAYVLSPLFFALSDSGGLSTPLIVPAIAVFFCLPVYLAPPHVASSSAFHTAEKEGEEKQVNSGIALSATEKIFLLYVLLFMAIVTIAISMMTYLLSEFYRFSDYAIKSGIVLTLMSVSSVAAILLLRPPRDSSSRVLDVSADERLHFRPILQTTLVLVTLTMVSLLRARLSRGFAYVLVLCAVMGFAYGLFLNSTRRYAGTMSRRRGKERLLTLYNNLQSIASLAAYVLTIIVWYLTVGKGEAFYPFIMLGIILILALELALILAWVSASRPHESLRTRRTMN